MSRVYFHSPSGDAELRGSERARLAHLANGIAEAAWDLNDSFAFERAAEILAMVPEVPDGQHGANYLHTDLREAQEQKRRNKAAYAAARPGTLMRAGVSHEPQRRLVASLRTALRANGVTLEVAGQQLRSRDVDLNTALVAGSDPVRLAAKIDGWCESHCWVEGPDRGWMADIIDEGLRAGLYRRGIWHSDRPEGPRDKWSVQGWEDVLMLLRARDDEPVVLSYSVTEAFPNPDIGEDQQAARDEYQDEWHELPADEQWRVALAALREQRPWARLAADTLTEVTFGLPVTIYDLFASDRDERVRAAGEG